MAFFGGLLARVRASLGRFRRPRDPLAPRWYERFLVFWNQYQENRHDRQLRLLRARGDDRASRHQQRMEMRRQRQAERQQRSIERAARRQERRQARREFWQSVRTYIRTSWQATRQFCSTRWRAISNWFRTRDYRGWGQRIRSVGYWITVGWLVWLIGRIRAFAANRNAYYISVTIAILAFIGMLVGIARDQHIVTWPCFWVMVHAINAAVRFRPPAPVPARGQRRRPRRAAAQPQRPTVRQLLLPRTLAFWTGMWLVAVIAEVTRHA